MGGRIGFVLFGLVIAFLAAEVIGRLVPDTLPQSVQGSVGIVGHNDIGRFIRDQALMITSDPYIGLKLRPNMNIQLEGHPDYSYTVHTGTIKSVDIGFRGADSGKGVYAVAVGDSFTFGVGVDEPYNWVDRLQAKIGQPVANLGLPSASSIQYTRMLERYGIPLHPKLVLWEYYPADVAESVWFNLWLEAGSPGGVYHWEEWRDRAARQTSRTSALRVFAERHSISYNLLLIPITEVYHLLRSNPMIQVSRQAYMGEQESDVGKNLVRESLADAHHLAQANGAVLVAVLFPTKLQIESGGLFSGQPAGGWSDPMRWIMELCGKDKLRCFDLTPAFLEHAASGEKLYFAQDGHWNEKGNELAAAAICRYLESEGLLPQAVHPPTC